MAYQTLRNEYLNTPPITRAYTTACVITTMAVVSILTIVIRICSSSKHFIACPII